MMPEALKVRPFDKIANDARWSGRIEDGSYVWRVEERTYRLRTVGIGTDERGAFASLKPFDEPLDDGRWLRVEAEHEDGQSCCRVSVLHLNDFYIDPALAARQQGYDHSAVNILAPPAVMRELSILFLEGGTPTEWIGPSRIPHDGPPVIH